MKRYASSAGLFLMLIGWHFTSTLPWSLVVGGGFILLGLEISRIGWAEDKRLREQEPK